MVAGTTPFEIAEVKASSRPGMTPVMTSLGVAIRIGRGDARVGSIELTVDVEQTSDEALGRRTKSSRRHVSQERAYVDESRYQGLDVLVLGDDPIDRSEERWRATLLR